MTYKGIVATTKVDAHKMRIAKEDLEEMAHAINEDECVPSFSIEHDLTVLPIGKVYKAWVDSFDDEDYALHAEQEIFENISFITRNGEKYIVLKSDIDDRPFASDIFSNNERLIIGTDFINFESHEKSKEFLEILKSEFDIDIQPISRKSAIPDPQLVFQLVESSVVYLLIYLCSKQVVERVGDALVDTALTEAKNLYALIKKTIKTGSKYILPKNRPVTYVYRGSNDYVIELIVRTTNPDIAISAISEEKLKEAMDKIDSIKGLFSKIRKVQLVYNELDSKWEFNYLTTETGEVIGTEQSYEKTIKLKEKYLGNSENINVSIGMSAQLDDTP